MVKNGGYAVGYSPKDSTGRGMKWGGNAHVTPCGLNIAQSEWKVARSMMADSTRGNSVRDSIGGSAEEICYSSGGYHGEHSDSDTT